MMRLRHFRHHPTSDIDERASAKDSDLLTVMKRHGVTLDRSDRLYRLSVQTLVAVAIADFLFGPNATLFGFDKIASTAIIAAVIGMIVASLMLISMPTELLEAMTPTRRKP